MQFRKDGKVFNNVVDLMIEICGSRECQKCEFAGERLKHYNLHRTEMDCVSFCKTYLEKASRLMCFEIIDEKETEMQSSQCDISKMTLEDAKEYCKNYAKKRQHMRCYDFFECELKKAGVCKYNMRKPSEWSIERHVLSQAEIDICRTLSVKWITVQDMSSYGGLYAELWDIKPTDGMMKNGECWQYRIGEVLASNFPSLNPGDCVFVEDMYKTDNVTSRSEDKQ